MKKRSGPGVPFKKGVSGNPKGRPIVPQEEKDIRKMALKYADDALQTLVKALPLVDTQTSAAISAAKELLDRGFGKSIQRNEHTGKDGEPIPIQFPTYSDKAVR